MKSIGFISFSDTIMAIIAKLRNAFDLHGLLNETSAVNSLFNTLQPEFVEIMKAYGDIVDVKGINYLMESSGRGRHNREYIRCIYNSYYVDIYLEHNNRI